MGCSSSCQIFETFSTALEFAARKQPDIKSVTHILDDFFFVAPSQGQCNKALHQFIELCRQIGVPISEEKTHGPATCMTFVGYEIDSQASQVRLPMDKVQKCKDQLHQFLQRRNVALVELQSLIGLLNFACRVIQPGRTFLRRIIQLTKGAKASKKHHRVRLTREAKADMRMWLSFLENFNGVCMFLDEHWLSTDALSLYTDASSAIGYGAVKGSQWFQGKWTDWWKNQNIALLELYPIVIAFEIWASQFMNQSVEIFSDNQAVVHIINNQTSQDPLIMILLRRLTLTCLRCNVRIKSQHIPGQDNNCADALSRFQMDRFQSLMPQADKQPQQIPPLPSSLQ